MQPLEFNRLFFDGGCFVMDFLFVLATFATGCVVGYFVRGLRIQKRERWMREHGWRRADDPKN